MMPSDCSILSHRSALIQIECTRACVLRFSLSQTLPSGKLNLRLLIYKPTHQNNTVTFTMTLQWWGLIPSEMRWFTAGL